MKIPVLLLLALVHATSCATEGSRSSAKQAAASTPLTADDVKAILELSIRDVLELPPTFAAQDVAPVQVRGYDGGVPASLLDKPLIRVQDALDWSVKERPRRSFAVDFVEWRGNTLLVKVESFGASGAFGAEVLLSHDGGGVASE